MNGLRQRGSWRGAIGLIAAYAIALQAVLAAFAPLPANAQDFGRLGIICFGSGSVAQPAGDTDAPMPAAGAYHCVLCGLAPAALPQPEMLHTPLRHAECTEYRNPAEQAYIARPEPRAGPSRAPPRTV